LGILKKGVVYVLTTYLPLKKNRMGNFIQKLMNKTYLKMNKKFWKKNLVENWASVKN